ncbi:unnamed protein product [Pylaiella littoralis]
MPKTHQNDSIAPAAGENAAEAAGGETEVVRNEEKGDGTEEHGGGGPHEPGTGADEIVAEAAGGEAEAVASEAEAVARVPAAVAKVETGERMENRGGGGPDESESSSGSEVGEKVPDPVPAGGHEEEKRDDLGELQRLIEDHDHYSLRAFLTADRDRADALLTQKYGGNGGRIAENGLYSGTFPLLHAALRGEVTTFSVVLQAAEESFRLAKEEQSELKNRDEYPEKRRDTRIAARSTHKKATTLKQQLAGRDGHFRSLPQVAALSGNRATLKAVLDAIKEHERDTWDWIRDVFREDAAGSTVLMAAAESGDRATFIEALEATSDNLRNDAERLKDELLKRDFREQSILQLASHGDIEGVVTEACRVQGFTEEEIDAMRRSPIGGKKALAAAVRSGSKRSFEAIADNKGVNKEYRTLDNLDESLLSKAVDSGNVEMFETICMMTREMAYRECFNIMTTRNVFGETLLSKAVDTRNIELFVAVQHALENEVEEISQAKEQLRDLIRCRNIFGEGLLSKIADRGNAEQFEVVWDCMRRNLSKEQLVGHLDSQAPGGTLRYLLLLRSCRRGDLGLFEAAMACVVVQPFVENIDAVSVQLKADAFAAEIKGIFLRSRSSGVQDSSKETLLEKALFSGPDGDKLLPAVARCVLSNHKLAEERSSTMEGVLSDCVKMHLADDRERHDDLNTISSLMACSARPTTTHIKGLTRRYSSGDMFKGCCLRAITSAVNPFVPGVILSTRLGEAASQATEGERRTITDIQTSIDALLLEILERLPRTVRGFDAFKDKGGMELCTELFEPQIKGSLAESNDLGGPLAMILSDQHQLETFCDVPLVMDFLMNKFTLGLPDLMDTEGVLKNAEQLEFLTQRQTNGKEDGLVLAKNATNPSAVPRVPPWFLPAEWKDGRCLSSDSGALLQAAHPLVPSLTYFPGGQFIAAGVVGKPSNYYKVPAMRMMLDFVVYVGMIAAISVLVLFHSSSSADGGATEDDDFVDREFSSGECACAMVFILAGIFREGREMWRNIQSYFKDQWNVLDGLGLLFLSVGMAFRWDDCTSPLGPAFYALSAPLLVSRVLFFAQIFSFQGPMIQVIFRMTTTLLKFGFVMVVVMFGFAMALHVLLRDLEHFGETFQALFTAMLGETSFFQVFSGSRYDFVATILLVVYLFIVTIMLLNLLVAILSTSHDDVQDNAGIELRVSKAKIISHYRWVVQYDLLPAPFNLIQLVLSSLGALLLVYLWDGCSRCAAVFGLPTVTEADGPTCRTLGQAYKGASRAFGRVVFWLVLGPVAVSVGALLWISSCFPFAQYAWYSQYKEEKRKPGGGLPAGSIALRWGVIFLWCIMAAPIRLVVLWLKASGRVLLPYGGQKKKRVVRTSMATVESLLRKGPRGVGADKLREFLEDPMNDNDVRQDEKDRKTTVEHIKLLRNRLEATTKEALRNVASKVDVEEVSREFGAVREAKSNR